jgi:sugar-specific transcriptional regulator TrmB
MAEQGTKFLSELDLTDYEQQALEELLVLGRSTAPELAEATGIPKARIYTVLDELAEAGYVAVIPGRPKQYRPHDPSEIVDRAIENRRDAYERFEADVEEAREAFVERYGSIGDRDVDELGPAEDLFHVVDVGESSERETRRLLRAANEEVFVISKSFGYLDAVRPALTETIDRGVAVNVLMLSPEYLSESNVRRQREIREELTTDFPAVTIRISERVLPWRGTFIDPSVTYDTGQGLFVVEQEELPNHLRQAAVTENAAFVAGLWQYFDLLWRHESYPDSEL